jgi:hypothetical protein
MRAGRSAAADCGRSRFSLVRGRRIRTIAGKTTTMRIILGLDAPTSGTALVGGRRYQRIIRPLRQVGSLLDATAVHGGRSAYDHLLSVALSNGIRRAGTKPGSAQLGGCVGPSSGQNNANRVTSGAATRWRPWTGPVTT